MKINELIQKELKTIKKELDLIENPKERVDSRIALVALLNSMLVTDIEIPEGKEAIKNDSKKKSTSKKKAVETVEVAETVEEVIPTEDAFNDESLQDIGIELKEEVVEKAASVKTEIEYEGVDITEQYHNLPHDMPEEDHLNVAYNLTTIPEVRPIYDELVSELKVPHSSNTFMLAYYIVGNSLEVINGALNEFSSGVLSDVYTGINAENIDAFVGYLNSMAEEE